MADHRSTGIQHIVNPDTWAGLVTNHPAGHLLQTWDWGELKAAFGWRVARLALVENGCLTAGAQVFFRPIPLGFSVAYVPKGPMMNWANRSQFETLLAGLHQLCRSRRSIFLKAEPADADSSTLRDAIRRHGFGVSPFTVQPQRTILVDLTPDETAIMAAMKQKTRYNIRLAGRKGVVVRQGTADDLPTFYGLMEITGRRDGFAIHGQAYYQAALELFGPDRVTLLLAEVQGEPVAALMAFAHGPTAYYLFGASGNAHRERMPTHLLQWEAMRWAKARGCLTYDLWGIPDVDEATLESHFVERSAAASALWGVYRFKRGFGGQVARAVGAFDYVYNRPLYQVYRQWMARRRGGTLQPA